MRFVGVGIPLVTRAADDPRRGRTPSAERQFTALENVRHLDRLVWRAGSRYGGEVWHEVEDRSFIADTQTGALVVPKVQIIYGIGVRPPGGGAAVAALAHDDRIRRVDLTRADDGIWESLGPRRHDTYSKVLAWVAFERAMRLVERFGLDAPLERWGQVRDEIARSASAATTLSAGPLAVYYGVSIRGTPRYCGRGRGAGLPFADAPAKRPGLPVGRRPRIAGNKRPLRSGGHESPLPGTTADRPKRRLPFPSSSMTQGPPSPV
jgi:hypothetical protein